MGSEGKPQNTLCDKYCSGCTIYETRPKVCATFECFWLKINRLPEELRPDKCNVVVSGDVKDGVGYIWLDELKENSFDITNMTPDQEHLLKEVAILMANQTIPTKLFLRSYNWKETQINIQLEQK